MKSHTNYLGQRISTEEIRRIESLSPEARTLKYKKILHRKPFSFGSNWNIEDSDNEMKMNDSKKICKHFLTLSDKAQEELRSLSKNAGKTNKKGKFEHFEVGGLLTFTKVGDVYSIGTKGPFINGEGDGTDVPRGRAGFHTHPYGEYKKQGVKYAWPSGDDFLAILEKMLDENCIVHIVATREGIYVISFAPGGLKKGKNFYKQSRKKKKALKYKLALPDVNDKNAMTPRGYIKHLREIKDPIFHVEYRSWKSANKKIPFYFPDNKGSCEP